MALASLAHNNLILKQAGHAGSLVERKVHQDTADVNAYGTVNGHHQETGSQNSDDGSGSNGGGSGESGSANSSATTIPFTEGDAFAAGCRVPPFLNKLYTIVDAGHPDYHATWTFDGEAFVITNPNKFAECCLPQFFKHNKLGSFQQQLMTYGFQRVPNTSCLDISAVWKHPFFRRGELGKLLLIKRPASKRSSTTSALSESCDGNSKTESQAMDEDEDLIAMRAHVSKLTSAVDSLHEELRSSKEVLLRALDSLVSRLFSRMVVLVVAFGSEYLFTCVVPSVLISDESRAYAKASP